VEQAFTVRMIFLGGGSRTWEVGFARESGEWMSSIGVKGQSPGRRSVGQVPQKQVIFGKSYYNDVI